MRDALRLLPVIVRNWLRTRAQLQLEILALRHRLAVLQRQQNRRPRFTSFDRIFWVWLYRLWPGCLDALAIMKPETVVRWHRKGFRKYWPWKSRVRGPGRPTVSLEIRSLVRRMSRENPLPGCAPDPRRVAQARDRDFPGIGVQVHGPAPEATLSNVANVSEEPRRMLGVRRLFHRPDGYVRHSLRLHGASP